MLAGGEANGGACALNIPPVASLACHDGLHFATPVRDMEIYPLSDEIRKTSMQIIFSYCIL